jgi:hypothetical protein
MAAEKAANPSTLPPYPEVRNPALLLLSLPLSFFFLFLGLGSWLGCL